MKTKNETNWPPATVTAELVKRIKNINECISITASEIQRTVHNELNKRSKYRKTLMQLYLHPTNKNVVGQSMSTVAETNLHLVKILQRQYNHLTRKNILVQEVQSHIKENRDTLKDYYHDKPIEYADLLLAVKL